MHKCCANSPPNIGGGVSIDLQKNCVQGGTSEETLKEIGNSRDQNQDAG